MYKHIIRLYTFLLPILRTAVLEVVAEEITRLAYPERTRRNPYDRRPKPYTKYTKPEQEQVLEVDDSAYSSGRGGYHDVIMVAFDIAGPDAEETQQWLMDNLPEPGHHRGSTVNFDSWWIANDERYDRSNCDSAVFVHVGRQEEARELLRKHGLAN